MSKRLQVLTTFQNQKSKNFFRVDTTKSRGPDELPPVLFRNTSKLSKSISQVFYKIQQTDTFPDEWKIGKVSPLFKKGSKTDITNYRPITLLNIVSKVFEKCVFDDLYRHVINYIPDYKLVSREANHRCLNFSAILGYLQRNREQEINCRSSVPRFLESIRQDKSSNTSE